jgi:putative membrane protein
MIYYDTSHLWGVLMRWHGSALNGQAPKRAFIMAMIAMVVAVVNHLHPFVVPTRDSTAFTDSLTVFNTFLGLIVSFRMNSAFSQWRAGVVAVGSLSEAARDIVGSGCAYVSTTIKRELSEAAEAEAVKREASGQPQRRPSVDFKASSIPLDVLEKCTFFTELRRLVFLYIAIVFHDCRGIDGIDKLKEAGVLSDAEYDELYACGSEHKMQVEDKESYRAIVRRTPHKLRATITELWLKRLVQVATNRGHLTLPNANALQQKLARLPNLYTTVFNIANVPIPFNYMQYLQFLLTAYMLLYTFVIVPRSGLYTPLWVFMWGTFLFMADEVAMEIECPFGLDANDIDLEARLLQIEEELTVLIRSQYYFVSGGTSLTRIPEISVPERQASLDKPKPAPLQSDFSFHQGRISPSHGIMMQQGSLPEINEFTKLIHDPSATSSSKSASYGSDSAA